MTFNRDNNEHLSSMDVCIVRSA